MSHFYIKAQLAAVRRDLDEILPRLKDEMMGWAPAEGMRTIGGQLVEIAATEMQLLAILKREPEISWERAQEIIGDPNSLTNLTAHLRETRIKTIAYIDSLFEEQLEQPAGVHSGWGVALGIENIPRSEVLRGIAQHEAYHVGQLTSYLWAHGDDPYEW